MTENRNDQHGQASSTCQHENKDSQQNQDLPRGVKDLASSDTKSCEKDENNCSTKEQNYSSECETGHKTYSGIKETHDSDDKECSNQQCCSDNNHIENQNFQGGKKSTEQEQHQDSHQRQCNPSGEENQIFQGDKSTGQVKFQGGQPIQGNQNRDQHSSPNTLNKEDDRDVSRQQEISHPEKERSTTTPYGGNSTDLNKDYSHTKNPNDDEVPVDESTLLK